MPSPLPTPAVDYLLMSGAELHALPTSGPAWDALVEVADGPLGTPDLSDQESQHGVRTLAAGLVYARTGDATYRDRARTAILDAIGTEREGASNSVLALARQLGSYVLAADFIQLSGDDDRTFRAWLSEIRTRDLGGHGRWHSLVQTHADSINNWGAFAGASRIAASLYLGDDADVSRAVRILRGFLGDRAAWRRWQPLDRHDAEWSCNPAVFVPLNPPCVRSGIDLDGAIVADVSRSGALRWPPGRTGLLYTNESLQALALQAELLRIAGNDAWEWSDRALLRAARFLERAEGWNLTPVSHHLPWLFNARYDLDLPTQPAGIGRLIGYTDWLYGVGEGTIGLQMPGVDGR